MKLVKDTHPANEQLELDMLLHPATAAERLGVSPKTLAKWRCIKRHPLPYVRVGRMIRYRERDIRQFVEGCVQPG